jgi:hypothetical protein
LEAVLFIADPRSCCRCECTIIETARGAATTKEVVTASSI